MAVIAKATPKRRWYVYIVRCRDGSLYTGTALDVDARVAVHNAGKGARYTRSRRPVALVGVFACRSQGDALRLEIDVKRRSKREKESLVRGLPPSGIRPAGRGQVVHPPSAEPAARPRPPPRLAEDAEGGTMPPSAHSSRRRSSRTKTSSSVSSSGKNVTRT